MANHSTVPTLAAGAFFGDSYSSVTTPLFQFSRMQATVPEAEVPRHTHETPHLILVMDGAYVTEARNQEGVCSQGTLIFNPAGTTHRDCFRSRKGRFLSISPGRYASYLLDRAPSVPLIIGRRGFRAPRASLIADRIVRELRLRLHASAMVLEGLGLELLGILAEMEERTSSRVAPLWLLQTKELIEDCVDDDLSIEQLAACAGVHPVYLARAYRRYFRCSPGEYLRCCRVLRVQSLLAGTNLPLVEISLQCGFSDQSQMTRSFSRSFGVPPAQYRSMRRP